MHVFMCTIYEPGACKDQKVSGPLELELQMVVYHHVNPKN